MGNENEIKNANNMKKKYSNDIGNNRNVKTMASDEENSDDDNINEEKEKQIDDYDKEISKMLFDEEAELDEGERLKKNRKKMNEKEEMKNLKNLKNYAQEIAEETFMEEINRSKSVNKLPTRKRNDSDDEDSDDFDSYKRWKEKKKKKKKDKEKNENKKTNTNNIKIEVCDDDEEEERKKKEKNKKKRNISSDKDKDQRNLRTEINDDNINVNINEELEKNDKKEKKKKKGGFFGFFKKKDKEKDKNKEQEKYNTNQNPQNTAYMPPQNYNAYNPDNPMGGYPNQMNNQMSYNPNQMYGVSSNIYGAGPSMGQNPAMGPDINQGQYSYVKMQSAQPLFSFGNKTAISKKAYSKIKPEDLRVVLLYMKNSNNKYQEGLDLCGKRQYNEAQKCFLQAKNSYMSLGKIMNSNPRAYPNEFRMVISKKINEKLNLVHQSLKECSNFAREQNSKQIMNNPEKAKEFLRNIGKKNNNNHNFNNFNFNDGNNNFNDGNDNSNNNNNQNKGKSIHDKEEDEMDEKIMSEIMVNNPGVKFDDIIGMKEMKRILYEIIVVPTIRPDLFTGIRKPQRGILLFGPPGTGKTMIAKAIASECHSTFFNISASSLTSKWVGESEKTVKSLFKLAYKKVPSIIFIDEIDSILSKRSENENEATKRLKTEFLIQFDGMGSNTNARLLVIAATNRPMDLDEALLRRLPKRVYCGPLDEEGRFEFIKKVINRVETRLSDRDIQEVAKMTKGYSNSDLKQLCKEAAFMPVRELTMDEILRIDKFRPLYKKDLVKACQKIRGTLSHKIINELLEWNSQFGGV